jgi:multicomponent Na+:H+ antiporter subunit G
MQTAIDLLTWACILSGAFFVIAGAAGMLRLPDFYTRLHAVSVCDTFGAGLIMLGLMLQAGLTLVTVKLLLILYFVLFTGPTATHALAAAAVRAGLEPATDDREP